MATFPMHTIYSEYDADIEDTDIEMDDTTGISVTAGLRLDFPLDNHCQVFLLVHYPGDPTPELHPDDLVIPQFKGESVAIKKSGIGLSVRVSGHKTEADPNPHPSGTRLTTIEAGTIPNVFVKK